MFTYLSRQQLGRSIASLGRQMVQTSVECLQANRYARLGERDQGGGGAAWRERSESTEYLVTNWLEFVFTWAQIVILWEYPYLSVCTIGGLLVTLVVVVYLDPRFYATVMIALFLYNLTKFWFRHVWPEIRVPPEDEEAQKSDIDRWTYLHPQVITLKELVRNLENLKLLALFYLKQALKLRQERPIAFCSVICSTLTATAIIGNRITGLELIFSSMIMSISASGVYIHLVPTETKQYLRQKVMGKLINHLNQIRLDSGEKPVNDTSNLEENPLNSPELSTEPSTTTNQEPAALSESLFDTLRRRSLRFYQRSSEKSQDGGEESKPLIAANRDPEDSDDDQLAKQDQIIRLSASSSHITSGSSESHNLIDFDDEQQHDGFVLL